MLRACKQRFRLRSFYHASLMHHRNPVGDALQLADVMRDKQQRHSQLFFQRQQLVEHLAAQRRVNGTCRLIGNEQLRPETKRKRHHTRCFIPPLSSNG